MIITLIIFLMEDKKRDVYVRSISDSLWKELRALAVKEGKTTAQALEEAIRLWIEKKEKEENTA